MLLRALAFTTALVAVQPALAQTADPSDWSAVLDQARGQTVYFNAWGGDERINQYIDWVGGRVEDQYGVTVERVPLADTADAVARVLAEVSAGDTDGGSIDLIWINGENFAAMRANDLLYGPFAEQLPNFQLVDTVAYPTTQVDFTLPTEGYESPWGQARFTFIHDSAAIATPPDSMQALAAWVGDNPGLFTYPRPPDFIGSTFLKQVLLSTIADPSVLAEAPPADTDAVDRILAPLWAYLDGIHPNLWRSGRSFPDSGPALQQLYADGEVLMALSFHIGEASAQIASGLFPESTRSWVPSAGSIGNTHFVAIPANSGNAAGAMVVANFLLSPEAQARKLDPQHWGDATVLGLDGLAADDQALFQAINLGPATLSGDALGPTLAEPNPDWMVLIEQEWAERYGVAQ